MHRFAIIAFVATLLTACAPQQSPETPAPTPSVAPTPTVPPDVTTTATAEFAPGESMWVVRPATDGAWPIVVAYHGIGGSPETMYPLAEALAKQGIVVFLPAWGAPPPASNDVATVERAWASAARALAFARENAISYGTTSDRVVAVGHSWGGPLVAALALDGESFASGAKATAAVSLDGPMDTRVLVPASVYEQDPSRWDAMNPQELVDARSLGRSKTFHLLAGNTWPESNTTNEKFADKVKGQGGTAEVTAFEQGHMEMAAPSPEIVAAIVDAVRE